MVHKGETVAKSIRVSIVVIVCLIVAVVGALSLPVNDAAAADPSCPASWPEQAGSGISYQDFFTDAEGERWFVIRSTDSNGYTTIRAYPADDGDEYTTNSPDEVCYLVVRRPGDTEDDTEPTQVIFPKEREEPAATPAPVDPQAALASRLGRNAAAFEYTIGKRGGSLTSATTSDPITFNLAIAQDAPSVDVLGHLFEGLTETSWLTGRVEPGLATRWERSADGLTWTFHLRPDARWHDGQPFTAHDVDFTFNRIIYNADIPANARAEFNFRVLDEATGQWREEPMTVTTLDDHTVEFRLPVPFAPFLRAMGAAIYPKHILEQYVDAGTFHTVWDINTDPTEVIGTGPFTIASYEPGQRVVLRRNPDYWLTDAEGNRLPYLDEIVHIIVPDLAAELARFRAGETNVHGVLGEEFARLEPLQDAENFTIHRRGPGLATSFLAFNMNPGRNPGTGEPYVAPARLEWFRTKEFRQAMAHVIDKDAIVDQVHHGHGFPQWSSISPAAGEFHNPNVRRYEYNIQRANAILDGLGWTDTDNDGVREDSAGNDIEFTLATVDRCSTCEQIGRILRKGMAAAGLRVNHRQIGFGPLVGQLTSTYDWEAVTIGFTGSIDPHDGITLWHSSADLHLWHPKQPQPATDWEAEIDDLYVRASQELNHERRVALYHRAQEIAAENVPLIYTTLGERISAVRNVFGNTTATLYGLWDIRYLYRTDR